MEYKVFKLNNGIQVLHQPYNSSIIHCCLVLQCGSRDEKKGEYGAAHFAEHMLFKQTTRRSNEEIIRYLEDVGGELNAYTTKEYTCLHASFMVPYLERAIDLLADIAFASVFPNNEIKKEKGVILDEIASYLEQPEEAIQDDFEEMLFRGTELAHNILGTVNDVKAMNSQSLNDFVSKNYTADDIAFGVYGNVAADELERLTQKYFSGVRINKATRTPKKEPLLLQESLQSRLVKDVMQGHLVLGCPAFSFHDQRKMTMFLVNNILGGGMSSRLNMEIREKHGIAYTIESNFVPFSDTGYFSVYLATDASKIVSAEEMVRRELEKMATIPIGSDELEKAKQRFKGLIALGEENRMNVIISMTKSLLDYEKVDSLEEVFAKIDNVSAEDIQQVTMDLFQEKNFSTLTFLPEQE